MSGHFHAAAIGIGSNLSRPRLQVREALHAITRLPGTRVEAVSGIYRTAPLGPQTQPAYLNAALCARTRLGPVALLRALQSIEARQGRRRGQRWGARTLDLDLLLYDRQSRSTKLLTLPHPEMAKRDFVLYPLAEIAPDWQLPDGRTVQALAGALARGSLRRISY